MAKKQRRTLEPLPAGNYAISLRAAGNWYTKHVRKKGVTFSACNAIPIIAELVTKIFDGQFSQNNLTNWMTENQVSGLEAEVVQQRLEEMILHEVLGHFPEIANHVPERYYYVITFDLILMVPKTHEEQRGIFF